MKKILSLLCSVIIVAASLSSCGGNDKKDEKKTAENTSTSVSGQEATSDDKENKEDGTQKNEDTKTVQIRPEDISVPDAPEIDIPDNAIDFSSCLKLGWNLGNTLDATGEGIDSEVSWGQPTVTKAQIQFVKDSGFTSIRIPVSWSNHVDENNNIDAKWMARVKEVVNYAYECGFYIILNSHHDCERYFPTEENFENASKYLKDVWTQICDNFADYDNRLIFESMNEPRLKDTSIEWWFAADNTEGSDAIKCIVKLNQVFIDTVRSNGKGNNGTRFLMVPSYAANPDYAFHSSFSMPTDTVEGKLILSVHAYTPYDFAMNKNGYKEWDGSKKGELNFIKKLDKKFIQNGYGVIIGEFGATNKGNIDDRCAWAKDYTGLAASYGIPCILWDNGGIMVGEENFGMINRRDLFVYYPALLEALLSGYQENSQADAA